MRRAPAPAVVPGGGDREAHAAEWLAAEQEAARSSPRHTWQVMQWVVSARHAWSVFWQKCNDCNYRVVRSPAALVSRPWSGGRLVLWTPRSTRRSADLATTV